MSTPAKQNPEWGQISHVAVIVAHPDDEILWAGGLLLSHPEWSPFIVTLCRSKDPDRAPRFRRILERLGAKGAMGDLDDSPDQVPLPEAMVKDAILSLLPEQEYDLLLTHALDGEYTQHRRHEEAARAVRNLWREGRLRAGKLWQFAYEDGGGAYLPRPWADADFHFLLPDSLWIQKHTLITEIYGFNEASWEARTAPRTEAFNCFDRSETGGLEKQDAGTLSDRSLEEGPLPSSLHSPNYFSAFLERLD
jgi:LmbE family N-acetylglucosaminyl deacetylase